MEVNEDVYAFMQAQLGYSDKELQLFKDNPRNKEILSKAPELMNKTIIAEVVASHGCNSQHKVGDKFYFDGAGNLLAQLGPKRICIYALKSFAGLAVMMSVSNAAAGGISLWKSRLKSGKPKRMWHVAWS